MTRAILTGGGRFFFPEPVGKNFTVVHKEAAKSGGLAVTRRLLLAVLLVDLAQLPFQFRDQFQDARPGHIVARLPRQRAVLHDLHFQFHPFVFVGHEARVLI
jgi:hypothetical protein